MFIAVMILGLYAYTHLSNSAEVNQNLAISGISAITAALTFVACLTTYLWAPHRHIATIAITDYFLILLTLASLIVGTGDVSSPYLALWISASVFAAAFGWKGLVPVILAVNGFVAMQYLLGSMTIGELQLVVFTGEVPLIVSYLIWSRNDKKNPDETKEDRSYHELATQLSQVAGKSEVVINAIADGVIALDSRGTIELINPAAQRIIGWGKQDALALGYKSVLKLVNKIGQELDDTTNPIARVLNTNQQISSDEFSLVTNSGKNILISIVISPVGQAGSGVIIVFRDITNEKAEERQQAEFISTASHEMRTPVASIEGYLGLVLNPNTATIDERARDFINKAHASAQHLGRLFQDLLDVTKADDGRMANNPKVIDVVTFTHDIVQGLKQKADEKQLVYYFKPMPDGDESSKLLSRNISPVFYTNVDSDHLHEVIGNLIENAIKYTPKGEVIIDVSGDDSHVLISVADTGLGIPREDQGHLFQKFYRVDNSDTREIGGTGLGLYLCRRLTEAMGGRIWVESEYRKGSTFYLELPRIDHEQANRMIEQASVEATAEPQQPTATPNTPVPSIVPQSNTTVSPQTQLATPIKPTAQSQTIAPQSVASQDYSRAARGRIDNIIVPPRQQ